LLRGRGYPQQRQVSLPAAGRMKARGQAGGRHGKRVTVECDRHQ
jgi:hypothetical protein